MTDTGLDLLNGMEGGNDMQRVRKALMAGFGAAVTAGVAALADAAKTGKVDGGAVTLALGAAIAAGLAVGWATWRIPNAPR